MGLRQLHLGERVRLGVRAEYFNLFNPTNFGGPFNLWDFRAMERSLNSAK
jgi:hypothetical protein